MIPREARSKASPSFLVRLLRQPRAPEEPAIQRPEDVQPGDRQLEAGPDSAGDKADGVSDYDRLDTVDASVTEQKPLDSVKQRKEVIRRAEIQLQDLELKGGMALETNSVYGAVIAIPQVARSMEWAPTMKALSFRMYLLLCLNYLLQCSAITFIGEESQVMDVLAGKMHLCDLASHIDTCPDGLGCLGPGGTKFTAARLYSFDVWSVRNYVRDALVAVLPEDKKDEIMSKVDPGEYGMENYWCRIMACFIFMMAEVRDLFKIAELLLVLYNTSTTAESWVYTSVTDNYLKDPLSALKFKTCGMPLHWKIINCVLVIVPKCFLLWNVCWMGFRFLMETAGILDLVLGCMTMDFILTFDELIFDCMASESAKHIMNSLEAFVPDETDESDYSEDLRTGGAKSHWGALALSVPKKLIMTILALVIFIWRYYRNNCKVGEDGSFVSKDMYVPLSAKYAFWNLITGYIPHAEKSFWQMPHLTGTSGNSTEL